MYVNDVYMYIYISGGGVYRYLLQAWLMAATHFLQTIFSNVGMSPWYAGHREKIHFLSSTRAVLFSAIVPGPLPKTELFFMTDFPKKHSLASATASAPIFLSPLKRAYFRSTFSGVASDSSDAGGGGGTESTFFSAAGDSSDADGGTDDSGVVDWWIDGLGGIVDWDGLDSIVKLWTDGLDGRVDCWTDGLDGIVDWDGLDSIVNWDGLDGSNVDLWTDGLDGSNVDLWTDGLGGSIIDLWTDGLDSIADWTDGVASDSSNTGGTDGLDGVVDWWTDGLGGTGDSRWTDGLDGIVD